MKLENKKKKKQTSKQNKEQEQKRKNENQKPNPKYNNKSDTPISGSEVCMDLEVFLVYYTKQNIHVYSLICFSIQALKKETN